MRKGLRTYLETIAENFPNMGKETVIKIQEVQRVSGWINSRRFIKTHSNQNGENVKTKIKCSKQQGKTTHNIQGNSHKVIS